MINSNPKISIILPVYNSELFLEEAISSILNQTYTDFECIIINDGSTDSSEKIIQSFEDKRIVYVKNKTNLGLIATLNLASKLCKGEFIARMDADDISLPNRLQKQLTFLEKNPEVDVVATKLIMINERGEDIGFWNDDYETTSATEIYNNMPKLNCIGHPTMMLRCSILKKYTYNKKFIGSEDWGLWLTLLSNGYKIHKLDEVLLRYRIHQQGTIVNANKLNVGKRLIKFKCNYLVDKILRLNLKKYDKKVLRYLLIDSLKYYFPFLYTFIVKFSETKINLIFKQWSEFNLAFKKIPMDTKAIFFFPFSHVGGAEIVHTEIVSAAAFTKPIVLFTSNSASKTLLPIFKKNAAVLEIHQLIIWPFIKKRVSLKIRNLCAQNSQLKLFSSNSRFFYELISSLPKHTEAVDLIHAFMHKHEDSAEKWSLPVINNLSKRIIINRKTAADLKEQYLRNKIDIKLLEKVQYISNFVETQNKRIVNFDGQIKILYVGRGTSEKRVHLLAQIAHDFKTLNLPIEFHFVGDVKNSLPSEFISSCILHGEIFDTLKLNAIYQQSHFLAMASTREGFPLVIMEAMMNGLIPISTNVGGISEHISNNINGILIDEIESDYFCERFIFEINALFLDKHKMHMLSDNAYEYARSNFNKEQFVNAYKRIFSDGL